MITPIKLKAGLHIGRMENASYFDLPRELDLNERIWYSIVDGICSARELTSLGMDGEV